ncbi:hypothetical protein VUR80DRAFT_5168 [Thermomyces stellatus]
MGPLASDSNSEQVNNSTITTPRTAIQNDEHDKGMVAIDGHEPVITRKKANIKKKAMKANGDTSRATSNTTSQDNEVTERPNSKATQRTREADIVEQSCEEYDANDNSQNTKLDDSQDTEADSLAGKDGRESQEEKLQAIMKLLFKEEPMETTQTSESSSVVKQDGEGTQRSKLKAIMKILGQNNIEEQDNKPETNGNMAKDEPLHDGSKGKKKTSQPVQGKDTNRTSPKFMRSQLLANDELYAPPGTHPGTHRKLDPGPSPDKPSSKKSADKHAINVNVICGGACLHCRGACLHCRETTSKLLACVAEHESRRKTLVAEYLLAECDDLEDLGTAEVEAIPKKCGHNYKAPVVKKAKRRGEIPDDSNEEEDPAMKRLVQIEDQIEVIDKLIETAKIELKVSRLECNARRLESYIHEQNVQWLHIHAGTPDWIVPDKYEEHTEVMEILCDEARKYKMEAAELRGEGPKPHVGECPCGQPVSTYLLYTFMSLNVLWLLASVLDH